jgi:hypothetical protein
MLLFEGTTKLPLKMEELQKVLKLKKDLAEKGQEAPLSMESMGHISLAESSLKDVNLVSYASNLRLSFTVDYSGLSKDEKFNLYKAYLNSRMLSEIKDLIDLTACILLERKGVEMNNSEELFLNKEEREEFCQIHEELIVKYESFVESLLVGLPFCIKEYASSIGKELIDSKILPVVTDPSFISSNVVSLILVPHFLEFYLSLPIKHPPKFFDSQWFEPVFNGFSLMSIMTVNSSLFPFMQSLYESWFSEEEIKAAC